MPTLEELEPKKVFHYFSELCKIPRGTFDTKRVSDYCAQFAKERGLSYVQDEANNVIIKKPGTAGYEDSEPVIIQGHLDMVCQKTEGSDHDFSKDPIEAYVDGNFIKAKDTTLGADDGIAVAYALAILDSDDIPHPPIEAVFTIDEEIGMGGAKAIDLSDVKGHMLMNIDCDFEGTIFAGCAGGVNDTVTVPVEREEKTGTVIEFQIRGLLGGHSGSDIDKQRGNANKLMGRLLMDLAQKADYSLVSVDGGDKENVITTLCTAKIVAAPENVEVLTDEANALLAVMKAEFGADDPNLDMTVNTAADQTVQAMDAASTKRIVFFIVNTPYGIQGFSRELKGLVETSLNLGIVATSEDSVSGTFMVRSSVETKKEEIKQVLGLWADYLGGEAVLTSDYPAWQYKSVSKLRPIMIDTYREMYGEEPIVTTIHAGLECGILSGQRPDLDCVSFGPNMYDIHSVNERLDIESTKRVWEYILIVLKNCK